MTDNTRSNMAENQGLSEQFAKEFSDKAKIAVDSETPFAAATAISETAITESADSKVEAYESMVDYDRAKTEVKLTEASEVVVESANSVLALLDKGIKSFADLLAKRGGKLVKRAETQKARAAKIVEDRQALRTSNLDKAKSNAEFKAKGSELRATRGIWGETGGRLLEWTGVKLREIITKPLAEIYSKGNHLEGAFLNESANTIKNVSASIAEFAPQIRSSISEKISSRKDTNVQAEATTKQASENAANYSQFTDEVVQNVVDNKFMMEDAAAKARSINQADGDSKNHAELNKFSKEMTNRVTGQ